MTLPCNTGPPLRYATSNANSRAVAGKSTGDISFHESDFSIRGLDENKLFYSNNISFIFISDCLFYLLLCYF